MYGWINDPCNFRAALAAGEHLLSLYKHNQVGKDVTKVPELCDFFYVSQTKLYNILYCQKYGKEEETDVKKPPRCVIPV